MNYLAHLYLSDGTAEGLLGSLLGDFVKADDHKAYPAATGQAIITHRKIDAFTDQHPVVACSKIRLNGNHRHTKGILIDLFYDHFLARHWDHFAIWSLKDFTRQAFALILELRSDLPERFQRIFPYMARDNWLLSYRDMASIPLALRGMARRLSRPNGLETGVDDLRRNYRELESDFHAFFPDLTGYVLELTGQQPPHWR